MLLYIAHVLVAVKQMVEISGLTDHLLGECEVRDQFHKCPRCGEAVDSNGSDEHNSCPCKKTMHTILLSVISSCLVLDDNKQCCPFCHSQITANENVR